MQNYHTSTVEIKGTKLNAIIADSFLKRAIGLMYRRRIGDKECMLFLFRSEGFQGIWMHNMLFSIDVIWLDRNERVVDYAESLKPCRNTIFNCEVYTPKREAMYLLETNSGFVKRHKIRVGDRLSIDAKH